MLVSHNCILHCFLQSGLYAVLMEKVDSFREYIRAPDIERFNLVLLGGKQRGW